MVAGHRRLNTPLEQAIDQPVIKPGTLCRDGTSALWHEPGPGHRKPIRAHPEVFNKPQVFLDPGNVIAGRIGSTGIDNGAWDFRKPIPDRLAARLAVAFDLPRAGGHPEDKISRKPTTKSNGRDIVHALEPTQQNCSVWGARGRRALCYAYTKFNTGPRRFRERVGSPQPTPKEQESPPISQVTGIAGAGPL